MNFAVQAIPKAVFLTIANPAFVARQIVAMPFSRAVLWQALLLVTALGVLVVALTQGAPAELPLGETPVAVTPLTYGLILGGSLVTLVFALHYTGAMMGGSGDFAAALALVIWLEVVAMAVRLVQAAILFVSPALGGAVSLAGFMVLLWCLANFVDVLHGFQSVGKAVLTLLLAVLGMSLGLGLMLGMIRALMGGV